MRSRWSGVRGGGWARARSGRTHGLHLVRLPLFQELGLLPVLMLERGLHVRIGALLRQVRVIALLHLGERFPFLLLTRLHRRLLPLPVELRVGGRLRCGWDGLGFGQVPDVDRHRTTGTARAHRVRLEIARLRRRGDLGFAMVHRDDEVGA